MVPTLLCYVYAVLECLDFSQLLATSKFYKSQDGKMNYFLKVSGFCFAEEDTHYIQQTMQVFVLPVAEKNDTLMSSSI